MKTKVSLTNRLQAELDAFWPGAAGIFCRLDSPIALAFLERYPSPTDARALGEKRLSGFLSRHGYCGGKSASELLAKLRSAPRGLAKETEETARRTVVLSLLAALRPVVEQIGLLESRIACAVRAHPDGEVFLSRSFATPTRRSPPPSSSPRSATGASATRAPRRWPPTQGCDPWPRSREGTRWPPSAAPATSACVTP